MTRPTLLGIAGALRSGSTNRKLVREAARLFGPGDFAEADLRLPLYDGDLEAEGTPSAVTRLAGQINETDAVVISTPEYNSALSGVLKNALDWVSRTEGNPWEDKPVAIVSAAAGRAGGARAQSSLRLAMTPFRPRLLTGPEVMIADARNAFDEDGRLTNERSLTTLGKLMTALRSEALRAA
ncbi:NAD(P)H-dependent oxidoreductase [Defluviimonas sp. WL0024]|uniref:NAD(P)H-dependent oxidoreductase n=2 Tax=Albidovulum TaxID=205889 RepID=A0ABT3IYL8_9RHOB|nr:MULTISPECIES: NADPH-dependent FMN reductase [Defluviimonas]MCU9848509.1 NAD(P)H-dependent oxidoreductase [Defluviimonas sp. WL0024]MCW3780507.1 NAD(P)H-dependent oxidoreductase [Defluviimonas salinarum]